ncbi:MAG: hypothetical protein GEU94_05470 [Micromonosporaceae bacterium]|nr:hypothetical protein [Micromonosporaceae bacterium]
MTTAALAAGGLFSVVGMNSAQAASCPTYAAKWVHKNCLSGVYTVTYKTRWYSPDDYHRASLRVGKFRGVLYAYAVYYRSTGYYDLGYQKIQINGNSWGYNWGQQTVTINSKYSRYTKALRSTSRSDVRFRACSWWDRFDGKRQYKFCTSYW